MDVATWAARNPWLARLGLAFLLCSWLVTGPRPAQAQPSQDVDLELRDESSPEYEAYLLERQDAYYARVDADSSDDAARMSLLLVKVGRVAFEVQRAGDRVDAAVRDMADQLDELDQVLVDEITAQDTESAAAFLRALRERFVEDMDEDLKDRLEAIRDQVEADNEEIDDTFADLGDSAAAILDDFGSHVDQLRASDRDFAVTFRIAGAGFSEQDLLQVGRSTLDDIEAAGDSLAEAAGSLSDAVDLLEQAEGAGDNLSAIQQLRDALGHLDAALATFQRVLDDQPFALEDVAPVQAAHDAAEALRQWAADVDTILAGRVFRVGDMAVRPVALIESRSPRTELGGESVHATFALAQLAARQFSQADDRDFDAELTGLFGDDFGERYFLRRAEKARLRGWLWVMLSASSAGIADPPLPVFAEFYSSPSPADFTFRGYFPEGLSPAMLELIGADLIVNTRASRDEMDAHMQAMRAQYLERLDADPADAEASVGLAIARTYFLVVDNHRDVLDAVDLAVQGDIAGLVERFDAEDFDYSASLDSTRDDIDNATLDPDVLFMVVDKANADGERFRIGPDDDIALVPLSGRVLEEGLGVAEGLAAAAAALAEGVDRALSDLDRSVELDLDPNLLDFSGAESGLDFAVALEESNEDFLRITPEGRDDLVRAGDDIADLLGRFSEAVTEFRKLMVALQDEDLDAGLAGAAVDFDDFYQEVHTDFATPEEVTAMGGTDVDLSAWFDTPPDSLLQRFIWYLDSDDGTDNSLGGLFPGKVLSAVVDEGGEPRPAAFALEPNYPNPFNPATTIPYTLSADRHVVLSIHDATGQRIRGLVDQLRPAGHHAAAWDGRDAQGRPVGSGVYICRMQAGDFEQARRLVLVR